MKYKIKTIIFILVLFGVSLADYPNKPIKIIVHTKPGGAVDLMARQLAQVASKYIDQSFIVINKPGGSGLLALAHVYNNKADGYTLLAFPSAFLAPMQTTDIGFSLDDFYYIACMTVSPEAIIINKNSELSSLDQIITHAKQNPGMQKWCGPGSGTLDHLMAVKIWDKAQINAKWIPYGGGGPAITSVMGKHSDVYVGNPEDILGREENLRIAAIADTCRHPYFPDTPIFKEYGIDLTNEVMWRGFAVKKGTPPNIIAFLEDILLKCSQDELWNDFIKMTGVHSVFIRNQEFTDLVKEDAQSSIKYLNIAGFKIGVKPKSASHPLLFLLAALAVSIGIAAAVIRIKKIPLDGTIIISSAALAIAALFYYMSAYFPDPREGALVGAATVPRVWLIFLIIMGVIVILKSMKSNLKEHSSSVENKVVVYIIIIISAYVLLMPLAGFFPATLFMLIAGILTMKYKKYMQIGIITTTVIIFLYFVFYKILMVPLPMGSWF